MSKFFRKHVLMDGAAGDGGGTGGGAGAAALNDGGGQGGQGGGTGGQGGGAPAWFESFQNQELRTWAGAKGFKDPESAVASARQLEVLMGAERAGRTFVLPKAEGATPEEIASFREKIGVPASPDDYKFVGPDGKPSEFDQASAKWMHEHGVPKSAAEGLRKSFAEYTAQAQAKAGEEFVRKSGEELTALKAEWGAESDNRFAAAKRAVTEFIPGATPEERGQFLNDMERYMGTGKMMRMLSLIGSKIGEHGLAGGGEGGGGSMTAEQAKAKITALKADKKWTAEYTAGDAEKTALWTELHRIAFPGPKGQQADGTTYVDLTVKK